MEGVYNTPAPPCTVNNQGNLETPLATAHTFANYYRSLQNPEERPHWSITSDNNNSAIESDFTIRDLQTALSRSTNSAPGHDGITYGMLQHLPPKATNFLLALYNSSWIRGHVPPIWKQGIILPLQKPGRTSRHPADFRPITLLPTIAKTMERLILFRCQWFLDYNKWWSTSQYGGLPGRRVEGALIKVSDFIKGELAQKKTVAMLFLDINKAFDTLPISSIIASLNTAKLPPRMAGWLTSFLYDRYGRVKIGQEESPIFEITTGVPQGAVLSPMLFNAGINSFGAKHIAPLTVQFVDDHAIGVTRETPRIAADTLMAHLPALYRWAQDTGITFNPHKTSYLVFSSSRRNAPTIQFLDRTISPSSSTKYLGITIDNKLRWSNYLVTLRLRMLKIGHLIRTIHARDWGANPLLLRRILLSLVYSRFLYGAPLYHQAARRHLDRLDNAIHGCIRASLSCPTSTAILSMYGEINLLPPSIARDVRVTTLAYALRAREPMRGISGNDIHYKWPVGLPLAYSLQDLPTYNAQGPNQMATLTALPSAPWTINPPTIITTLPFRKGDTTPHNEQCLEEWINFYSPLTSIFTDASRERTGDTYAGFLCPSYQFHQVFQFPDRLSTFHAELLGIRMALQWIATHIPPGRVVICTDSLSALTYINSPVTSLFTTFHSLIRHSIHSLETAGISTILVWVPSHSAIAHNDAVDKLVSRLRPHPWYTFPIATECFQTRSRAIHREYWHRQWAAQINSATALRPSLSTPIIQNFNTPRVSTIFTLARVGRIRTQALRNRWNKAENPMCPWCMTSVHDLQHILLLCPHTSPRIRSLLPTDLTNQNNKTILPILLGIGPPSSLLPHHTYISIANLLWRTHTALSYH